MAQEIPKPTAPITLTGDFDAALDRVDQRFDLDPVERRTYRARTEPMLVVPQTDPDPDSEEATGVYRVFSSSGSEYTVEIPPETSEISDIAEIVRGECPDMQNNPPEYGCKHVRRVFLMFEETALPRPGESAESYWDWFFECVRLVNRYHDGLDEDLRRNLVVATGAARYEMGDYAAVPRISV